MDSLHALHWFQFAADDLDSAKILVQYGERKASTVCFHAQQSAEKNLKGVLVVNGVAEPPKIHDLRELCFLCAEHEPTYKTLLPHCHALNAYGTRVKYPDELDVDERTARKAIADAEAIHNFEPIAAIRAKLEAEHGQVAVTQVTAYTATHVEKLIGAGDKKTSALADLEDAKLEAARINAALPPNAPNRDNERT